MYGTTTKTSTYTVLDVRKTFEGCEADIRTIARRTGKWSMEYVDNLFSDILSFAENDYLHSVDIVLIQDATGKVLRASKFVVNTLGSANDSERAGRNNEWTDIEGTHLTVILSHTQKWRSLSQEAKSRFEANLKISWSPSKIDNKFPHLRNSNAQLYASKGYELQKTNYK